MALASGARLGAFEILAPLGAGGMGEVYRAHDAKLGRDVALKILPDAFASDPERLARLEREARTLAALNHPHIAQIYGLEAVSAEAGSRNCALVMELVEGENLAQRIARGAIPLDEALPIARQIVDALDAAHEQLIIHRDLKPANIKVRPDGMVKVLDFGLAKALMSSEQGARHPASFEDSPTISPTMTIDGMIQGTFAYMSPEQARGKVVDKRADIWAFGCVLYEMLTGRRAFAGDQISDVLAAVIRDAPSLDALPPDVPIPVRRLLRRCLEKDRAKRLDSMRVARLEIDDAIAAPTETSATPAAGVSADQSRGGHYRWWHPVTIAGIALVAGASGGYWLRQATVRSNAAAVSHFQVSLAPTEGLGPRSVFDRPFQRSFVVTPDGKRIVFAGALKDRTQIYLRAFDSPEAIPIAGTEGAQAPFVSPDGAWVGFLADGLIRKVSLASGPVMTIADLKAGERAHATTLVSRETDFFGASWGDDGTIVFGRYGDGLWQVDADGAVPTRLTSAKPLQSHRLPHHLPNRRGLLLTTTVGLRTNIAVLPRGASEPTTLIESATDGRYVSTGHVVFVRDGVLMAAPFDLNRLVVGSPPVALVDDVMEAGGSERSSLNTNAAQFDLSPDGTLLFASGGMYPHEPSRLVWVDRSGQIEPIKTRGGMYATPRLSPDGRRVAVAFTPPSRRESAGIFIVDLPRGTLTRLTSKSEWAPLWSVDGSHVLFMETDGLGRTRADGSSPIEHLLDGRGFPHSLSPDGLLLAFQRLNDKSGSDLWLMALEADRTVRPLLQSPANEAWAEISPDGRWLAYGSDSSEQRQVYVQPFPGPGRREQISFDEGSSPLWAPNGRELFFIGRSKDGKAPLWSVEVKPGPTWSVGEPRELFSGRFILTGGPTGYDVSLDGKRFLMVESLDLPQQPVTNLRVVLNWHEELQRLVPTR